MLLPLSLPGWVAGATLVFASSTTAFISQSVIGGGRLVYLPTVIWQQAMVLYNWPFAAVASMMLLLSRSRRRPGARYARPLDFPRRHDVARAIDGRRHHSFSSRSACSPRSAWSILVGPVIVVLMTSLSTSLALKFPPPGFSLQWYEALFDTMKSRHLHVAAYEQPLGRAAATTLAYGTRGARRFSHCPRRAPPRARGLEAASCCR